MDEIKDIIKNVVGKLSTQAPQKQQEILDAWERVTNNLERKHTKITRFQNKILTVHVDAPAFLYQINLKKKKILKRLQEENINVEKVYFRIGKI